MKLNINKSNYRTAITNNNCSNCTCSVFSTDAGTFGRRFMCCFWPVRNWLRQFISESRGYNTDDKKVCDAWRRK
jgi:hypothetical protein